MLKFNITQSGILASLPYLARFFAGIIFGAIGDIIRRREWLKVTTVRKSFCLFCMNCLVPMQKSFFPYLHFYSSYHSWTIFDNSTLCERTTLRVRDLCYFITWIQWCRDNDKSSKFTRPCSQLCRNIVWVSDSGRKIVLTTEKIINSLFHVPNFNCFPVTVT